MPLETGTYISSLNASNPAGTDTVDKADDHLRLIKSTLLASFPGITGAVTATHTELNILDGATLSTTELNYVDGVTSAIQTQLNAKQPLDATLTALAALTTAANKGLYFTGADTPATYDLSAFALTLLDDADAAAMRTTLGISATSLASTTEVLTGTDTAKSVTPNALAALWEQGTDVASAGTISLGEGGYFNITGTTTITDIDFGTDKAGRKAHLKFAGALTLTHGANLILPGAANITTAAGDVAEFVSEGTDVVRCVAYTKASGRAVVEASGGGAVVLGTISTTSGSSASLGSLNLTDYKVIQLWFRGVSHNGGGGRTYQVGNSTADDVGVSLGTTTAADLISGVVIIDLADGIGLSWLYNASGTFYGTTFDTALSTATTTITVAMSIDNFDAGSIRVVGYK